MPFTPVAGGTAKVTVGSTDIPAINWSLAIDGKVKDVSNFRDGRSKVGTLTDATLSATVVWDSADLPTASGAANLRASVSVAIKCYVDAVKYFTATYVISTIGPKNEGPEGVMMMDFTAGLSGTLTYPT